MSDLQENLQWLLSQGYALEHRKKYKFTEKFYEDLTGTRQGLTRTEAGEYVVVETKLPLVAPPRVRDWSLEYMNFISESQVPMRLLDSKGTPYSANKYSEDGMKAFRKALESGIEYSVLVKSTMLYYKSSVGFKKAIGNYMKDGDWRSDYKILVDAAQGGEQSLTKHIEKEIRKDEPYHGFTIG